MSDTYTKLCDHARETALLTSIQGLLDWDEQTQLPVTAGPYRAEQLAYLAGKSHQRVTDPALGEMLAELVDSDLAADPHSESGAVIHHLKKNFDKQTKLPQPLVEELTRTRSLGQQAWQEARTKDDFKIFQPLFTKIVDLKQQEAAAYGFEEHAYDALLDDYEPGESTTNVAQVLAGLRDQLVPLVQKIAESDHKPQVEILRQQYPVEAQEAFGKQAAEAIGFDFQSGRLDVTAHPFCGGAGPNDVRLTTRYDANDFVSGFYSILHEAGHGIYEQGLPSDQFGLPTGEAVSLGIHESQSRMWENLVGRSRAFLQHFLPQAQQAFPEPLGGVDLETLFFAINDSRPSLIRVESDEATYNLHIMIRFELEQALLTGDLKPADAPGAWDEKYQQYLGIKSPSAADGILQDVHWSAGLFGYFPTYSLGNLYASQFFEQAEADLGSLDEQFAKGDFASLLGWLRENIHQHGQRYSAAELVEKVTGKPLSHDALMRHLNNKYGELYGF